MMLEHVQQPFQIATTVASFQRLVPPGRGCLAAPLSGNKMKRRLMVTLEVRNGQWGGWETPEPCARANFGVQLKGGKTDSAKNQASHCTVCEENSIYSYICRMRPGAYTVVPPLRKDRMRHRGEQEACRPGRAGARGRGTLAQSQQVLALGVGLRCDAKCSGGGLASHFIRQMGKGRGVLRPASQAPSTAAGTGPAVAAVPPGAPRHYETTHVPQP